MKFIVNLIKSYYPLILILTLAFTVRVYGIYFDFPGARYIDDESYHISYIVKALSEKSFYPDSILPYPFFLTFLYFPVVVLKILFIALKEGIFNVAEMKAYMITEGMGQLIILTRWYSVLFGTTSVYLVYRIAKLILQNRVIAYFVSLASAFSLVPVFLSHWGRVHSAMLFFVLLALFFIIKFEKTKAIKFFYLSNIAAALAFSVHYLGINAFIFPLAGWLQNRKTINQKVIYKNIAIYILAFLFFYALNFPGVKWMIEANLLVINWHCRS